MIWGPLTIRPLGGARNIAIGSSSFFNTNIRFGVPSAPVTIGRNVQIGPSVSFETVGHGLFYEPGKGRGDIVRPIVAEDEVWVAAGAIITAGSPSGAARWSLPGPWSTAMLHRALWSAKFRRARSTRPDPAASILETVTAYPHLTRCAKHIDSPRFGLCFHHAGN